VIFSLNRRQLVLSSHDHIVHLWNIKIKRCFHTFSAHIYNVFFSSDNLNLVTNSEILNMK
jgi:WD40 repeat protein